MSVFFLCYTWVMKNVADEIRRVRIRKGLSLREVSELSGISSSTIQRVELGQVKPKMETIFKIASALKIKLPDPSKTPGRKRASSVSSTTTSSYSGVRELKEAIKEKEFLTEEDKRFLIDYVSKSWRQYNSRKKARGEK